MRFTNSLRLLMENFKHIYKLLIYRVSMTILVCALCSVFVVPELLEIVNNPVTQGLLEDVKNIFLAFVSPELETPGHYVEAVFGEAGSLKDLLGLLFSMRWELVLVCLGCVLVYLAKRFADTLVYFALGSIVNDKMSTYAETSFTTAFVSNLGKASVYAALYVPFVFLIDVGIIVACCLLLRFLPVFAALFLSVTLIVVCQALKLTFTGPWMPAMTADGERLRSAIRYKGRHEKKQAGKAFMLYVVTVYIVIIVNVVAAIFTFGSALLITIPTSYLLFICEQHVNYYTMKGKKYFITYESIATNPDRGDSEHFFDYIEEAEKENAEETVVNEQEK